MICTNTFVNSKTHILWFAEINLSIGKHTFCDLCNYIWQFENLHFVICTNTFLQFEQPLVSSLTGGRGAKPTYNQTFHPISGSLPLNSPVNWSFTRSQQLSKRSVSVCLMVLQYADQCLIIWIFEFPFGNKRVQILWWGRPQAICKCVFKKMFQGVSGPLEKERETGFILSF